MQDNAAVKDVVKAQQRCFDVKDVEPDWEADVVADEQDVFVSIDVNGLIGSCRKRKLSVVRLKRHMICEVRLFGSLPGLVARNDEVAEEFSCSTLLL